MRGSRPVVILSGLAACVLYLAAGSLPTDGSQGASPGKATTRKEAKGAKPKKEEQLDPAQWDELLARRDEIVKEISALDRQARTADDAVKQKLFQQFQALDAEFRTELQPRMIKLAPLVLAKDPGNLQAAEVVINVAYRQNRYQEVLELGRKLLDADKSSPPLLNIVGISQFATHDFEKAQETLTLASQADPQGFAQMGGPYLEACEDYLEYWKKEQELRAAEAQADDLPRVLLKTTRGDIVLELFENEAPNTVANFISLVEGGKYDGVAFHRVIPNFMAQGGDPNTLDGDPDNDGGGGPGYTIPCECYQENARKHFQGSISMAHAGKDTGGSQFFLTHLPTTHLNYVAGKSQSNHTVFGRIVKGLPNALELQAGDKIQTAKVLRKRDHEYVPKTLADKRRNSSQRSKKKVSDDDR
ncbi:MAG: peptidylprolyl isomerase [Planctomycetales bacterium]